ncbi:MAG: protein kinase [Deltaproteobacteria bacterium]
MFNASMQPGTVFAREFRVVRALAQGGMGSVYVAVQLATQKERALKVMRPSLVRDARSRERFLHEARAGAALESDHVVEVVGAGVDDETGAPWLAMELLRGETLAEVIAKRGRLEPREVRECMEQMRHALTAAHRVGLVHRDLKPENIFLATPRRADVAFTLKVLDFGIAKTLDGTDGGKATQSTAGSPLWMAPEQANAEPVSTATDVWPLGLLAYWMLTGRYYWNAVYGEGTTIAALLGEVLLAPIEPASVRAARTGLAGLLPPGFDAWFARCVDRTPMVRFAEGGAALTALLDVLDRALATQQGPVVPQAAAQPGWPTPSMPPTYSMPSGPIAATVIAQGSGPISMQGVSAVTVSGAGQATSRAGPYVAATLAAACLFGATAWLWANARARARPSVSAESVPRVPVATPGPYAYTPVPPPALPPITEAPKPGEQQVAAPVVAPRPALRTTAPVAPRVTQSSAPRPAVLAATHGPVRSAVAPPVTPVTSTNAQSAPPTRPPSGAHPPTSSRTAAIAALLDSADRSEAQGNHAAAEAIRESAWGYVSGLQQQADQATASQRWDAEPLQDALRDVRAYMRTRLEPRRKASAQPSSGE